MIFNYVCIAVLFVIAMVVSHFFGWKSGCIYASKLVVQRAAKAFNITETEVWSKLKASAKIDKNTATEILNKMQKHG